MTLKEALQQSKSLTVFSKGSIKAAENMIGSYEPVLFAATVNVAIEPVTKALQVDFMKIRGKISGVLAVTSRRVLFCNNVLGQGISKQINLSDIQSVDDARTITQAAKVRIVGLTEMFVVDGSAPLATRLLAALDAARAGGSVQQSAASSTQKLVAEELKELKNLVDLGVITQEDFNKKKNQLLGI